MEEREEEVVKHTGVHMGEEVMRTMRTSSSGYKSCTLNSLDGWGTCCHCGQGGSTK